MHGNHKHEHKPEVDMATLGACVRYDRVPMAGLGTGSMQGQSSLGDSRDDDDIQSTGTEVPLLRMSVVMHCTRA